MASSTTKPVAMVSAISDRLFRLKPSRYMTPKVPTSESGTATAGITVPATLAQEEEDHEHDEHDREEQLELHVARPTRGSSWCGR